MPTFSAASQHLGCPRVSLAFGPSSLPSRPSKQRLGSPSRAPSKDDGSGRWRPLSRRTSLSAAAKPSWQFWRGNRLLLSAVQRGCSPRLSGPHHRWISNYSQGRMQSVNPRRKRCDFQPVSCSAIKLVRHCPEKYRVNERREANSFVSLPSFHTISFSVYYFEGVNKYPLIYHMLSFWTIGITTNDVKIKIKKSTVLLANRMRKIWIFGVLDILSMFNGFREQICLGSFNFLLMPVHLLSARHIVPILSCGISQTIIL